MQCGRGEEGPQAEQGSFYGEGSNAFTPQNSGAHWPGSRRWRVLQSPSDGATGVTAPSRTQHAHKRNTSLGSPHTSLSHTSLHSPHLTFAPVQSSPRSPLPRHQSRVARINGTEERLHLLQNLATLHLSRRHRCSHTLRTRVHPTRHCVGERHVQKHRCLSAVQSFVGTHQDPSWRHHGRRHHRRREACTSFRRAVVPQSRH